MFIGIILMALINACSTVFHSYMINPLKYSYSEILKQQTKVVPPIPILNQNVEQANEAAKAASYKLLSRVTRWSTDDITAIRAFLDNGMPTYAHLPDEQLWIQHAFHYLPGVIDLLNGPHHDKYFIKTPQGRCARSSLVLLPKQKNKPKEVCRDGTIEIGIDTHNPTPTIYHMMFHPKENTPSIKIPYMVCLKKQNKPAEEHKKTYKQRFKTKKVKKTITYFNREEKAYIIKYTAPPQSLYKSITIHIHMIERNSPSKECTERECCSVFMPYKRLLQHIKGL